MRKERKLRRALRRESGNIVEAICGGVVMVLILLGFMDVVSIIVAQYQADSVVYNLCRAAASASSQSQARLYAASKLTQVFASSPIVSNITISTVDYEASTAYAQYGLVTVKINTTVNLLAPLPFFPSSLVMQEQASLPILTNLNTNNN